MSDEHYIFLQCSKEAMNSSLRILKCVLQVTKSLKHDNFRKLCLCLK